MSAPESFQSLVVVVVHPVSFAKSASELLGLLPDVRSCPLTLSNAILRDPPRVESETVVVGHEPQSLSDVRSTDARNRDTGSREGVADSFHVSLNKVEPAMPNCSFNLFTKDDRRAALFNEPVPVWPKVPLVEHPST